MFLCYLCEKERCYTSYFCENCRIIKNIGNCYGYKEVREVLEKVCLRDVKQRQYKINDKLKEEIEKKVGYFAKKKDDEVD